jgi:hypothetical protein
LIFSREVSTISIISSICNRTTVGVAYSVQL